MHIQNPVSRRLLLGVIATLAFAVAPITSALADTVAYYLDQSNVTSALPNGTDYLKVTITSTVVGTAMFDVTPVYNFTKGTDFGLQSFGFNYSGPNSISTSSFSGLASGWNVNLPSKAQDGFGKYDVVVSTTASSRISSLDFTVTGLGDSTATQTLGYFAKPATGAGAQGNQYFAAHLTGFTAGSTTSAYFAGTTIAPVPEPESYAMLLGGLAILGFMTRRSKKERA